MHHAPACANENAAWFGPSGVLRVDRRAVLEMEDHVAADEHQIMLQAVAEGRLLERVIISNFRADLDLRAKPMLPAQADIGIGCRNTCPLASHVVVDFSPKRNVV